LEVLEAMQVCGPKPCPFTVDEALGALLATRGRGCGEAVEWLVANKTMPDTGSEAASDAPVPAAAAGAKKKKKGKGAKAKAGEALLEGGGGRVVVRYTELWDPEKWEEWPSVLLALPGAQFLGPPCLLQRNPASMLGTFAGGRKGFVFFCNSQTYSECVDRMVFGLQKGMLKQLQRIDRDAPLFLFNFQTRQLHGVFYPRANPKTHAGLNLVKEAWKGRFPAQLEVIPAGLTSAALPTTLRLHLGALTVEMTNDIMRFLQRTDPRLRLQFDQSRLKLKKKEKVREAESTPLLAAATSGVGQEVEATEEPASLVDDLKERLIVLIGKEGVYTVRDLAQLWRDTYDLELIAYEYGYARLEDLLQGVADVLKKTTVRHPNPLPGDSKELAAYQLQDGVWTWWKNRPGVTRLRLRIASEQAGEAAGSSGGDGGGVGGDIYSQTVPGWEATTVEVVESRLSAMRVVSGIFMYQPPEEGAEPGAAPPAPARGSGPPGSSGSAMVRERQLIAPQSHTQGRPSSKAWIELKQIFEEAQPGSTTYVGDSIAADREKERRAAAKAAQRVHTQQHKVPRKADAGGGGGEEELEPVADWPAVAVFRRSQVMRIMEGIADFRRGPMPRFVQRKASADVFNKWLFQVACLEGSLPPGFQPTTVPVDVVIPSTASNAMIGYLCKQLYSAFGDNTGYNEGKEEERDEAEGKASTKKRLRQLVESCHQAARRVRDFATHYANELSPIRVRGAPLTDHQLGLTLCTEPVKGGGGEPPLVLLQWQDMRVSLWESHYQRLVTSYERGGHPTSLTLARIFSMVVRYETLTEVKSAYQAALPANVMAVLAEDFGVRFECFASPLNCYFDRYCSLFQDTDQFFGSEGSFFGFRPESGSFECNPPFDQQSIVATYTHICELLQSTEQPLSFFVCIPKVDIGSNLKALIEREEVLPMLTGTSHLLRHRVIIPRHQHAYLMGLQHRKTGESRHWVSTKDSVLSWFQNPAGARRWPVERKSVQRLVAAFESQVDEAQAVGDFRKEREEGKGRVWSPGGQHRGPGSRSGPGVPVARVGKGKGSGAGKGGGEGGGASSANWRSPG